MYHQRTLSKTTKNQPITLTGQADGLLTQVRLNYPELVCIELALLGLEDMIRQIAQRGLDEYCRENTMPDSLIGLSMGHLKARLRYLRRWLDKPAFSRQLRYDGMNTVLWPFTSSELVDWLCQICQSCITRDAILLKAYESASEEFTDVARQFSAYDNQQGCSLVDELCYSNIRGWQDHYSDIANTCQSTLVRKLVAIQQQGYPLFPTLSLFN